MQQDIEWFKDAPVYQLRDAVTVGHGINERTGKRCVLIALEVHNQPVVYGLTPERAEHMAEYLDSWAREVRHLIDKDKEGE